MAVETRERKSGKSAKSKEVKKKPEVEENQPLQPGGDASNTQGLKNSSEEKKKGSKSKKSKQSTETQQRNFLASCCDKLKYVFLLLFIPPFLNYAALQKEAVELKPDGELYDVGWGRKMLLSCVGEGSPTVILDAPTGMSSDVWALVAKKLKDNNVHVCVYDRAGLGFSERPQNRSNPLRDADTQLNVNSQHEANPFTVESMAEDLHVLVTSSSQQPRPLILVGAEIGALVAQFYAHIFEGDVLGMVLVNPLPDELFSDADGVWVQQWFGSLGPTFQSLQLGAALGITRLGLLFGALQQPITGDDVPEQVILRQKYLLCHPRHLSSVVDEHHFINETFSQIRTLRKLRSIPSNMSISVLSGNYYDEQIPSHLNKAWAIGEQKLLSKLPPNVQHIVVNGADRHMMYRKPDPVVDAVMRIVRKWWRGQGGASKKV